MNSLFKEAKQGVDPGLCDACGNQLQIGDYVVWFRQMSAYVARVGHFKDNESLEKRIGIKYTYRRTRWMDPDYDSEYHAGYVGPSTVYKIPVPTDPKKHIDLSKRTTAPGWTLKNPKYVDW